MKKNPYSLTFGMEPEVMIPRSSQMFYVLDTFCSEKPAHQIFMVTGVRGSGKTVFMTNISHRIRQKADWISVELNPKRDILESLAAKLSSDGSLQAVFQRASINLSFFGFGLDIKGSAPIRDIETALIRMLDSLKKQGKKLLITIDEVDSSHEMIVFAHSFQIFIREKLPVFLLMTGLYENIDTLQNEKTLTFLHRAPKIHLEPLNMETIADNYLKTFSLEQKTSMEMSKLTRGFSYAFQVLGYFTWEYGGNYTEALPEYRQHLEEFVYQKIWSELSSMDRRVVHAITCSPTRQVRKIREYLSMESNQFAPYRDRLIKKGIVNGKEHGYLRFTLPLFEEFAQAQYFYEDSE